MGIRSALRLRERQAEVARVAEGVSAALEVYGAPDTSKMPFASPWSTSNLDRWAWQDMFGNLPQSTRQSAMAIPSAARARTMLAVQGAKQPLVAVDLVVGGQDQVAAEQPYWMRHTADGSTPFHRMLWTIDDLIWYPASLWLRNSPGTATETRDHVNYDDWEIDTDTRSILVNGKPMSVEQVILLPGPHEGVLNFGRETIVDVRNLYKIVSQRVENPVPNMELHQTGGAPLNKDEKDELLAGWRAARQDPTTGGVAYTSQYIEVIERGGGSDAAQMMVEARNAAAVDVARMIGVHAGMIDATTPKASLNYETQAGRNQEFEDYDADLYLTPIAARLSLDDVCPDGQYVAFDRGQFTTLTPAVTGPDQE